MDNKENEVKLYYDFSDFGYVTESRPRVLSNIRDLDYLTKGFEFGCITIWTGLTNCLDKDTEYFNGKKWKKLNEYTKGEKVLQYNADGTATLEKPKEYIKQKCELMYSFQSRAIDMVATPNHDLVYLTSKGNINKKEVRDVIQMHETTKSGFSGRLITTFNYSGKGIDLTDAEIKVMVMTICDGSFRNMKTRQCCVNVKKERKKERARKILNEANIQYIENKTKNGYSRFYFKPPIATKVFLNEWYGATNSQLKIFADECVLWDGSLTKSGYSFSTTVKKNADFIQFAVTSLGYRANIETQIRSNRNTEFTVIFSKRKNTIVGFYNPREKKHFKEYIPEDGYCYCFTMPSGMLVVRRNDKIMITGNSGKTTVMTMLTKKTIKQGEKIFYFNGEQTKDDFKNNLYKQCAEEKDLYDVWFKDSIVKDTFVSNTKAMRFEQAFAGKLFLYNNEAKRDIDTLIYAMDDCRQKHGVNVFILDNFMQIDIKSDNVFQEQTSIMEKLRTFAVNKQIHVHLVAHPRKVEKNQVRLDITDIAGSMNLANKAYNIISIMRRDLLDPEGKEFQKLQRDLLRYKYDISNCDTILEVLKTKGNSCGLVGLSFNQVTKTLEPAPTISNELVEKLRRELKNGGNYGV